MGFERWRNKRNVKRKRKKNEVENLISYFFRILPIFLVVLSPPASIYIPSSIRTIAYTIQQKVNTYFILSPASLSPQMSGCTLLFYSNLHTIMIIIIIIIIKIIIFKVTLSVVVVDLRFSIFDGVLLCVVVFFVLILMNSYRPLLKHTNCLDSVESHAAATGVEWVFGWHWRKLLTFFSSSSRLSVFSFYIRFLYSTFSRFPLQN